MRPDDEANSTLPSPRTMLKTRSIPESTAPHCPPPTTTTTTTTTTDVSEWKTVRQQKRSLEPDPQNDALAKSRLKKQEKLSLKKQIVHFPPEFHFDTRGFRHGKMVQLKDVRDLTLSIMADERNQEWMLVKNKSNIQKMVVLMIPGITTECLGIATPPNTSSIMPFPLASQTSKLPILQSLFSHACPTKAAGDRLRMFSCLNVFLTCQLSAMAKVKRDEERKKNSKNVSSVDPTTYLLSSEDMVEHNFPSLHYSTPISISSNQQNNTQPVNPPSQEEPSLPPTTFDAWLTHPQPGYIQTPMHPDGTLGKRPIKILGIDCEMCVTASGSELTRCTIVDWEEKLVYDQLVLPDLPITDYLTRFSGITEERLKDTKIRLLDVQKKLSSIINYDTILVGHSIDCDLKAIKLSHPWIIDTSIIYHHPRGSPMKPSLKWLAAKWLNKQIQNSSSNASYGNIGHDSEEDARTAIQLLKKKLEKGLHFGQFSADTESIFERISRVNPSKKSAFVDFGNPSSPAATAATAALNNPHLPPPTTSNKNNSWKHADCFAFPSDSQVAQGIISAVDDHDFVFGRFMGLSHALGWSQQHTSRIDKTEEIETSKKKELEESKQEEVSSASSSSSTSSSSSSKAKEEESAHKIVEKAYENLNQAIKDLSQHLSPGTSLIIFNGHSDPRAMAQLNNKKNQFEKSLKLHNNNNHYNHHQQNNNRSFSFIQHPAPHSLPAPAASSLPPPTLQPPPPLQESNPSDLQEFQNLKNNNTTTTTTTTTIPLPLNILSWTNQDDRDLADAVDKCKLGMSFYRIQ